MNRMGRTLAGAALLAVGAVPATAQAHTTVPTARTGTVIRVVRRAPNVCTWVPARRVIRERAVVVRPGYWQETVHPERVGLRWDSRHCRIVRVVVSPRRVERTWIAAVVKRRREAVTVPGYWKCDGHRHRGHVHQTTHLHRRPVVRLPHRGGHH